MKTTTTEKLLSESLGTTVKGLLDSNLENPLQALAAYTMPELMHKGLTEKQAVRLLATLEIGRRVYNPQPPKTLPIESPDAAAAYLFYDLSARAKEHFALIALDIKHRPIGKEILFIGSSTATLVSPGEIFKKVLCMGATRLIVAHNHPSGDVTPSADDLSLTEQLYNAGNTLDLPIMDHLIIGNHEFHSIRENSRIWQS